MTSGFLHVLIIFISQAKLLLKKKKKVRMCISQFPVVAKCKGSDVSKGKVPTDSAGKAELTLTAAEMGRK